jgi:hypothetical protein
MYTKDSGIKKIFMLLLTINKNNIVQTSHNKYFIYKKFDLDVDVYTAKKEINTKK